MASLLNKVVLITGASTGIGAHIAKYMAAYKPKLVLVARSANKLKTVEAECLAAGCGQGDVLTVTGDMEKIQSLTPIVEAAVSKFGQLDVLVNNAAAFVYNDVEHTSSEDFDRCMAVNIRAPFFLAQAAMTHLKKSQGCVVNLSSVAAHYAITAMAPYSLSKAALEHFTRILAFELAPSNVRVNAVHCGFTKTDTFVELSKLRSSTHGRQDKKPAKGSMTKVQPLGGMCEMEDVSKVVTFLASDLSSALTGAILPVTRGGHLPRPNMELPEEYINLGHFNPSPTEVQIEQLKAKALKNEN